MLIWLIETQATDKVLYSTAFSPLAYILSDVLQV